MLGNYNVSTSVTILMNSTTTTTTIDPVGKLKHLWQQILDFMGMSEALFIFVLVAIFIMIIAICIVCAKFKSLQNKAKRAALTSGLNKLKPSKVEEFEKINFEKYDSEYGYTDFIISIDIKKRAVVFSSISAANVMSVGDDHPDCYMIFTVPENRDFGIKAQSKKTKIIYDSYMPFFDTKISFKIPIYPISEMEKTKIFVQIFDYNESGHDILLGETVICLSDYDIDDLVGKNLFASAIFEEPSSRMGVGELCLILTMSLEEKGYLKVTLLEMKDLVFHNDASIKNGNYPAVQATISLYVSGKKKKEYKTKKVHRTRNPYFMESMTASVSIKLLNNSCIKVEVHEMGLITRKIGHVYVGKCSSDEKTINPLGEYHWTQMIAQDGRPFPMWHSLLNK